MAAKQKQARISKTFLKQWFEHRARARTDTLWLAREVLGYKDITPDVHQGLLNNLPKFLGGTDEYSEESNQIEYTPKVPMWELEGPRKFLSIFMRGGLKTTICTCTHAIQWIINYSDVRILASTAINDQAKKLVTEIKGHFQFNDKFRWLFPEFCPKPEKVMDFGSQEGFTTPARQRKITKEMTFSTCSLGKIIAGGHFDVIIHSDIVDKENIKTPFQLQEVKQHYKYMGPLLERSHIYPHYGWTLVEGTIYDFSDLHQELIDKYKDDKTWSMYIQGCYKSDGKPVWPARYPQEELERIRVELGDYIFASQYMCKPIPLSSQLASQSEIRFIPKRIIDQIYPTLRLHVTIDLAGMEADKTTTDSTVITLGGFDRDGRLYILEVHHGRFTAFEVIELIFAMHTRHPRIYDFKIEKENHARVLLPFLKREMSKRQKFPLMIPIKRDTRVSKMQRILGLQPWFRAGIIAFAETCGHNIEIINQITRFPNTPHDDILDTIADQMQNRDGIHSDMIPAQRVVVLHPAMNPFLGFDPITREAKWLRDTISSGATWHEGTGL